MLVLDWQRYDKDKVFYAEALLKGRCVGANFSYYLDCQHQAIHATRH